MYREPNFLMDFFSSDGKGNQIKRVKSINEILTDFEIEVSNVISGSYDKSIIHLTVMGGSADGVAVSFSFSFGLTKGKEYILFLGYEERNDKWWTIDSRAGVFEEVVIDNTRFVRNIYGEKLKFERFISRIKAPPHE